MANGNTTFSLDPKMLQWLFGQMMAAGASQGGPMGATAGGTTAGASAATAASPNYNYLTGPQNPYFGYPTMPFASDPRTGDPNNVTSLGGVDLPPMGYSGDTTIPGTSAQGIIPGEGDPSIPIGTPMTDPSGGQLNFAPLPGGGTGVYDANWNWIMQAPSLASTDEIAPFTEPTPLSSPTTTPEFSTMAAGSDPVIPGSNPYGYEPMPPDIFSQVYGQQPTPTDTSQPPSMDLSAPPSQYPFGFGAPPDPGLSAPQQVTDPNLLNMMTSAATTPYPGDLTPQDPSTIATGGDPNAPPADATSGGTVTPDTAQQAQDYWAVMHGSLDPAATGQAFPPADNSQAVFPGADIGPLTRVGQFFQDTAGNLFDAAGNIVRGAGRIAGDIGTTLGNFFGNLGYTPATLDYSTAPTSPLSEAVAGSIPGEPLPQGLYYGLGNPLNPVGQTAGPGNIGGGGPVQIGAFGGGAFNDTLIRQALKGIYMTPGQYGQYLAQSPNAFGGSLGSYSDYINNMRALAAAIRSNPNWASGTSGPQTGTQQEVTSRGTPPRGGQ